MSESKGLQRYNGVEQDDEGAYVYYDEHIAALRRAKAEVWPKVNAPAMYDDPDPGWVDTAVPDLAALQRGRE